MSAAHDDHDHGDHSDPAEGPVVLSVSDRHPRVRTIQVVRPGNDDTTFLTATAKGLTAAPFSQGVQGGRR